MTFKTTQAWNRYQGLQMRGEVFQAVRIKDNKLTLVPENRRVFAWEWMAEQGIEGRGESIYDQLQAVLDAERLMHMQDWLLLRPGMRLASDGMAGLTWMGQAKGLSPNDSLLSLWPPSKHKINMRGSSFAAHTFETIHFKGVDLRGSVFGCCRFVGCDLGGIVLPEGSGINHLAQGYHFDRCIFERRWLPRAFEHCFDPMLFRQGGPVLGIAQNQSLIGQGFFIKGASTR